MSKIHWEMRAWRKHLKESRMKECVSCHKQHKMETTLCLDCDLLESEWS